MHFNHKRHTFVCLLWSPWDYFFYRKSAFIRWFRVFHPKGNRLGNRILWSDMLYFERYVSTPKIRTLNFISISRIKKYDVSNILLIASWLIRSFLFSKQEILVSIILFSIQNLKPIHFQLFINFQGQMRDIQNIESGN